MGKRTKRPFVIERCEEVETADHETIDWWYPMAVGEDVSFDCTADAVSFIKRAGEAGKYRIVQASPTLEVSVEQVAKVSVKEL